jgi:serine/threonine-protein kinase
MTAPGDVIDGRFRLDRTLGMGGMGIVYLATDLAIDRQVAVKILRSTVIESEEARTRLQREMEVLARLKSPHIAEYHSSGYLSDHSPYLVIEYLSGCDLRSELRLRGVIPIPEACAYLLQTCRGMAVAHAQNIVHRDLKPHNLILTSFEARRIVKVVDFGIAKILGSVDPGLTASDSAVGTPLYMCPEQLLGPRRITTRSDVWSLGVILYELISGISPFSDDSPGAVIAAITLDDPVPIRQLVPETPKELADLIHRALQKRPERRLPSVEVMAETLGRYALPDDRLTVPPESNASVPKIPRRRPVRLQRRRTLRDEIRTSVDRILIDDSVATQEVPRNPAVPHAVSPDQLGRVPTLEAALASEHPTSSAAFSATRASIKSNPLFVGSTRQRMLLVLPLLAVSFAGWLTWSLWGRKSEPSLVTSTTATKSTPSTSSTRPTREASALTPKASSHVAVNVSTPPATAEVTAPLAAAKPTSLGSRKLLEKRTPTRASEPTTERAPKSAPSQTPKDKAVPLYL